MYVQGKLDMTPEDNMSWQRLAVHRCASRAGRCAARHSTPGHLASGTPLKQASRSCTGSVPAFIGLRRAIADMPDTADAWESLGIQGTSMHPPP